MVQSHWQTQAQSQGRRERCQGKEKRQFLSIVCYRCVDWSKIQTHRTLLCFRPFRARLTLPCHVNTVSKSAEIYCSRVIQKGRKRKWFTFKMPIKLITHVKFWSFLSRKELWSKYSFVGTCVCSYMCKYVSRGQSTIWMSSLRHSSAPFCFPSVFEVDFSLVWSSSDSPGWLCHPRAEITSPCHEAQFFKSGFRLRFLCLQGKISTGFAISPAQLRSFDKPLLLTTSKLKGIPTAHTHVPPPVKQSMLWEEGFGVGCTSWDVWEMEYEQCEKLAQALKGCENPARRLLI